jgi:hypothetical protein
MEPLQTEGCLQLKYKKKSGRGKKFQPTDLMSDKSVPEKGCNTPEGKKAGDRIRTGDFQLGKLTFYR